jgi:hypothetical protein
MKRAAMPRRGPGSRMQGAQQKPRVWRPAVSRRGKYGNVSCSYNGRTYDSRMEARYAERLDLMRRLTGSSDRVVDVKPQAVVHLEAYGKPICIHIVDFMVTFADGRVEYHEVKGLETPAWSLKHKLFCAQFPDTVYKVIRRGDV